MRRPNLFIVGAPKCGTTSLHAYLNDHPEIFFPDRKELNHFGADLSYRKTMARERYERFYESWGQERYGGEASVFYLYSTSAAAEIAEYNPDARVIAMVRQPVDAMFSLYLQMVRSGDEDAPTFEEALALEPERRAGRSIPATADHPHGLRYREVVDFAPQIRRYQDAFGPESVHVIVYDDLAGDTAGTYRQVLQFLGLPDDDRQDFSIRNPASRVRSPAARDLVEQPPAAVGRLARAVLRNQRLRQGLRRRVRLASRRWNTVESEKPALAPDVRAQLTDEVAPAIADLAALLDRDLGHWLDAASADAASS